MKAVLVSPQSPACLAIGDAPDPQADSNQAIVRVSAVLYGVSDGLDSPLAVRDLMATGAGRVEGFHLYRESQYTHSCHGLARLMTLMTQQRLTTQVSRVEDWSQVGEVAQALIDRSYSGKAVLTIEQ